MTENEHDTLTLRDMLEALAFHLDEGENLEARQVTKNMGTVLDRIAKRGETATEGASKAREVLGTPETPGGEEARVPCQNCGCDDWVHVCCVAELKQCDGT